MRSMLARGIVIVIKGYQKTLSPDHSWVRSLRSSQNQICVYYPTCSEYAIQVVEKYGPFQGSFRALQRIASCHPWQKKHIDIP